MSGLTALAVALAVGLVVLFCVLLWAAVSHAAWIVREERRARQIEITPSPNGGLGRKTRRPPRGASRRRPD